MYFGSTILGTLIYANWKVNFVYVQKKKQRERERFNVNYIILYQLFTNTCGR